MTNKILIKLYVISLNKEFDVFIPVNEMIWKIKKLLIRFLKNRQLKPKAKLKPT